MDDPIAGARARTPESDSMLKTKAKKIIGNVRAGEGVPPNVAAERLIRLNEVLARTGLGQAAIYDRMLRGEFPKPVRISQKCSRWIMSEVEAWIAARIADRDKGKQPVHYRTSVEG